MALFVRLDSNWMHLLETAMCTGRHVLLEKCDEVTDNNITSLICQHAENILRAEDEG